MGESATVVRVRKGRAWVHMARNEACLGCGRKSACFGGPGQSQPEMEVIDPFGVLAGDRVEILFPRGIRLWGPLLVFGLPLCLMMAGAGMGYWLALPVQQDKYAAFGALAGFALSLLVVIGLERLFRRRLGLFPSIVQIETHAAKTNETLAKNTPV